MLANIAYQAGTYLRVRRSSTLAVILSILWGLLILGILILRIRNVLHVGLMEAALERSARTRASARRASWSSAPSADAALEHAAFCNACVARGPGPGHGAPAAGCDGRRPGRP